MDSVRLAVRQQSMLRSQNEETQILLAREKTTPEALGAIIERELRVARVAAAAVEDFEDLYRDVGRTGIGMARDSMVQLNAKVGARKSPHVRA